MRNDFSDPFASFFQAGFECSSHRRRDGVRLDLIRATGHDKHVLDDYRQLRELGFATARDGLRWHLIEQSPGQYDWASWRTMLDAAEEAGLQVAWDLFHYGSPDCIDQGAEDFPQRFTDFAMAALELQQSVTGRPPVVCPLNEINFMSWAVDDVIKRGELTTDTDVNHLVEMLVAVMWGMGFYAGFVSNHEELGSVVHKFELLMANKLWHLHE